MSKSDTYFLRNAGHELKQSAFKALASLGKHQVTGRMRLLGCGDLVNQMVLQKGFIERGNSFKEELMVLGTLKIIEPVLGCCVVNGEVPP